MFVCRASVTSPLLNSTMRPYKPYIFCVDMILAMCHHILYHIILYCHHIFYSLAELSIALIILKHCWWMAEVWQKLNRADVAWFSFNIHFALLRLSENVENYPLCINHSLVLLVLPNTKKLISRPLVGLKRLLL